jgi:amino acid permease
MKNNGIIQIDRVIITSISVAYIVYLVIGVIGYLSFGNKVSSNIIQAYPPGLMVTFGQISIGMLALFTFPLQCHPCRISLDKILPFSSKDGSISTNRYRLITVSILITSYTLAICVNNLSTVLSVVGATGSTTICYILPGLFYYKISLHQFKKKGTNILQRASIFLVILGLTVMTACLYSIILANK